MANQFGRIQRQLPSSTRMTETEWQEVSWAADRLNVSKSLLLRSAALCVAKELREGAKRPLPALHH